MRNCVTALASTRCLCAGSPTAAASGMPEIRCETVARAASSTCTSGGATPASRGASEDEQVLRPERLVGTGDGRHLGACRRKINAPHDAVTPYTPAPDSPMTMGSMA